ncbi:hypothetical protein GW17_00054768 [Ensete ventricosum]|nr:hypothetical protein GW17_00054768 [Ensete ventricosum]
MVPRNPIGFAKCADCRTKCSCKCVEHRRRSRRWPSQWLTRYGATWVDPSWAGPVEYVVTRSPRRVEGAWPT